MTGRHLSVAERESMVVDLLNVDIPFEDIAVKYGVNPKTVYILANRSKVDLKLRRSIIGMKLRRKELTELIDKETRRLAAQATGNL